MGEHEFNKRAKSKELKPISAIVVVPVPPLIDRETFEAVQALFKARHPTVTPSAVISGPTMLTGMLRYAKCGGAMTIRTGKGGRYRYYACSMKARQGRQPAKVWRCRWTSWTMLSPAISKTVSSSLNGWKRSSPRCATGGRSDPSARMSTLAN